MSKDDFEGERFTITQGNSRRERYLRAAQALAERAPKETLKSVAATAGVAVETLRGYLKQDTFRELVTELTDHRIVQWMPQIDQAMVNKAMEGSVGAAQYVAQRAGRTEVGYRDKNFQEFMNKLPDTDQFELEYYLEHGHWPDEEAATHVDGPEGVQ